MPLAERVNDLRLYEHQLAVAVKRWPCDEKCKDGARFFYPCREIISIHPDGDPWEIDTNPPPEPDYKAKAVGRVRHGSIPAWVLSALRTVWPEGTKNDTCFRLGCALGVHGFSVEEIVDMILASPNYRGKEAPKKEVFSAVTSGVKRGFKDIQKNQ